MEEKYTIIIHHSADFDGLLCREIALFKFQHRRKLLVFGWDYGKTVPQLPAADEIEVIVMMDIAIAEILSDESLRPLICLIDHHKTTIDTWGSKITNGDLLDGVAACRLVWQYYFGGPGILPASVDPYVNRTVLEPTIVRLAGEHDVWDHRDPDALPLQEGLRLLDDGEFHRFCIQQFLEVLNPDEKDVQLPVMGGLTNILQLGRIIQKRNKRMLFGYGSKHAYDFKFEGLLFLAMNTSSRNSLAFDGLVASRHDGLFCWRYDGKDVTVSLYGSGNRPALDLSIIAKKYGGGGHRNACGFKTSLVNLVNWMNECNPHL